MHSPALRYIILYHYQEILVMATPVKVKKWGNSMAVLIPKQFAEMREIEVGTVLDIEPVKVVDGKRQRRYKLSELVADFKPQHRQGEWELGGPVGREVW